MRHREGELTARPTASRSPRDLSGQDFWTLIQAGYPPVGMVMGTCVYHVAHQGCWQWFKRIGQNVEMPNFTQALYDARELAMERMQAEAEEVQAEGIVGVQLRRGQPRLGLARHGVLRGRHRRSSRRADHQIPPPTLVLDLS